MIHDLDLVLSLVPTPVRSVAAVGVSVFGGHEDIANARVEFEDGCVANLTASRASYQAVRKMRLYGAEGYATLDFAARQGTLVRPSDRLRRGELGLEGLDVSQPTAIKDHVFGTLLRVDQVHPEGYDSLTRELEDFVRSARERTRPRVTGDDALRAMRVADLILRDIRAHQWEGLPDGPTGPHEVPLPTTPPSPALRGPISWRPRGARRARPPRAIAESEDGTRRGANRGGWPPIRSVLIRLDPRPFPLPVRAPSPTVVSPTRAENQDDPAAGHDSTP